MGRMHRLSLLAVLLLGCAAMLVSALEPPPKTPVPGPVTGTDLARVEKGPFVIQVHLKGLFESSDMTEIALHPQAWLAPTGGSMTLLKAVPPGTLVKKGETLFTLDPTHLDRAIHELQIDQQLTDLGVIQAEKELEILKKSIPQDIQAAERAKAIADEDLKSYLAREKAMALKTAKMDLESSQFMLESSRENLRQLEKMYRDKDLTEETEQIILKRERHRLQDSEFRLEVAQSNHEKNLKVLMPRKEVEMVEATHKAALALEKATSTLPPTLAQKTQALLKARHDRDRGAEKLKKLQEDRLLVEFKAPAEGLVYYGRCVQGQWPGATEMAKKLHRNAVLTPDEVIMTIVRPQPLWVRASVEEKDLPLVPVGAQARVTATAFPDRKIPATVEEVATIPLTPGTFEVRLKLASGEPIASLVPGMNSTVTVTSYRKAEALTVPLAALREEEDSDKMTVYVKKDPYGPEKRTVTVGRRSSDRVEILSGLEAGEKVLLSKP